MESARKYNHSLHPRARLFIGGVSKTTDDNGFRRFFEQYGEIEDVVLMRDKMTGAPRGFGFVTFKNKADVRWLMHLR